MLKHSTRVLFRIQSKCSKPIAFDVIVGNKFFSLTRPINCVFANKPVKQSEIIKNDSAKQIHKIEEKSIKLTDPEDLKHFKKSREQLTSDDVSSNGAVIGDLPLGTYVLPHPIWSDLEVNSVTVTHTEPKGIVDNMAFYSVKLLRKAFDLLSGFTIGVRNEKKWLRRVVFLETVAGVPGMVAAMTRHLHSLRRLRRDHGWIHTLLEEAENERMHLMTAMQLSAPGPVFRLAVVAAQGTFVSMFSLAYLMSPRYCHRFVGYLEEEAVITYTKCLKDIDHGPLTHWQTQPAPEVAVRYWCLPEPATMRDVILAIRADESHHRDVNHTLASLQPDQYNPYPPGK